MPLCHSTLRSPPPLLAISKKKKKKLCRISGHGPRRCQTSNLRAMFYFPLIASRATLCSSSRRNIQKYAGCGSAESSGITSEGNDVLASLSGAPEKRQSLHFSWTPRTTHTHLRLQLSDGIILLFLSVCVCVCVCLAWRQRLGSQIEVVPEVPSGMASSHVCSLDSAKATGTGHAPLEQEREREREKKRMFGAILSPHRQLQIAHMARLSESVPLSSEAARNNNEPSKRVQDFFCRANGSKKKKGG